MVGVGHACVFDGQLICGSIQRFLSSGTSTVRATSLVGEPKRLEEPTQQFALNHPTLDLLQLAPAVVKGLSDCFTTNRIRAIDASNE
jgi:hypothetical protein